MIFKKNIYINSVFLLNILSDNNIQPGILVLASSKSSVGADIDAGGGGALVGVQALASL